MKLTKLTLSIFTLALSMASAASTYNVTLLKPASVGGTELAAGKYTVEMEGEKAIFKSGKKSFEVPAALEATDSKNSNTGLAISGSAIKEVYLGGTKSKIVLKPGAGSATAAQ